MVALLAGGMGCNGPVDVEDGGPPEPSAPLPPVHLKIAFDYRFDRDNFFRPERRRVLEAAAATWGRLLASDFDDVPAGTPLLTRDPSNPNEASVTVTSEDAIDDILVFVGTADLGDIGGNTARAFPTATFAVDDEEQAAALMTRYDGPAFAPWTGWIAFDTNEFWYANDDVSTDADIPAQGTDLYTNAFHELGHVLGVGTAPAFHALVNDDGQFIGDHATALYGEPVPLSGNATHFDDSVLVDGERILMDVTDRPGARVLPSALDLAVLEDLCYELVTP